jgi:cytochrome P450
MKDVMAVLHDSNFVVSSPARSFAELAARANRNYDALINLVDATPVFQDGSRQRQTRQIVARILNRVALSELRPAIKAIASSLCAQFRDREAYDAIAVFAVPFPEYVMAHILGLPSSDVPVLDDLLASLTLIFDTVTLELCDELNAKLVTVLDLLKSRISEVIAGGQENGLSILYSSAPGSHEQKLAEAAVATAYLYRMATEGTIGLIGMLFRLMIERPALIEELCARPELIPATVSEVIRLESNIQRLMRICRATCEIGGKVIKAGEPLLLLLGAANRDPASFADPDGLNPHRGGIVDVAFGAGRHFCSGASLARFEGCVALEQILDLPPIQRAGPEEWYPGRSVRRLRCLPVQVKKTRSN